MEGCRLFPARTLKPIEDGCYVPIGWTARLLRHLARKPQNLGELSRVIGAYR